MDQGEKIITQLFEIYGLETKRFDKGEVRRGKTPDFRVFDGDKLVFICELKCAQEDEELDEALEKAPPFTTVQMTKPGTALINRLTSHIHKAIKQFDAVNPHLESANVLAMVNLDDIYDSNDFFHIVENYKGWIENEKYRIHLYIWMNEFKINKQVFTINGSDYPFESQPQFLFNTYDRTFFTALCTYFNITVPVIGDKRRWWRTHLTI